MCYSVDCKPVDDSINDDLDGILISQQVNNFHGMFNNPNSHQLLPIVTPVHHQRICEPLHNWALGFPESLDRVPASCVGDIGSMLGWNHSNVIQQRHVFNLYETKIN